MQNTFLGDDTDYLESQLSCGKLTRSAKDGHNIQRERIMDKFSKIVRLGITYLMEDDGEYHGANLNAQIFKI